jgi:hypothetical protein
LIVQSAKLSMHRNTTFRWHHQFFILGKDGPAALPAWHRCREEPYAWESKKGARRQTRPARPDDGHAAYRAFAREAGMRRLTGTLPKKNAAPCLTGRGILTEIVSFASRRQAGGHHTIRTSC